jgi:high-affinity iron transporter
VLREGFESSVFLLAAFDASTSPAAAGSGAVLGFAFATVLGWGIYRGGIRIDLVRFFRVTGVVLVFVAAGLLASAAHTAHEAGWVTSLQGQALDLTWLVDPGSIRSALLTGMLGLQPRPTQLEVLVYVAFAVPMFLYVLWPGLRLRVREERAPATSVETA